MERKCSSKGRSVYGEMGEKEEGRYGENFKVDHRYIWRRADTRVVISSVMLPKDVMEIIGFAFTRPLSRYRTAPYGVSRARRGIVHMELAIIPYRTPGIQY